MRWGFWRSLSAPLASVTVDERGIEVRESGPLAPQPIRLDWGRITRIEAVRSIIPLPTNVGLRFIGGEKQLIVYVWGAALEELKADVRRLAPGRLVEGVGPRWVL
jgi:hypothetical protein